ncbi:MAG: hypothetical protein M1836_002687 [Candelina mexicana]|nr:MAG: hypothetical protein M1836_002687 [Candelina mexicana]
MHAFKHLLAILAAGIFITNAAPQPAAQSEPATVDSVTTTTTVGPTVISGDKIGAAAFTDRNNSTYIVYQAKDTSIHSLSGAGPPVSGSTYSTSVILAADVARNDTPIAVAVEYTVVYAIKHIFYLSSTSCPGGNYLYELVQNPIQGTWFGGSLNALKICSSSSSNLLYALWPCNCGNNGNGPLRVGYVAAGTEYLSEVNNGGANGWVNAQY